MKDTAFHVPASFLGTTRAGDLASAYQAFEDCVVSAVVCSSGCEALAPGTYWFLRQGKSREKDCSSADFGSIPARFLC